MKPLISMAGLCAAIFLQACDRDTVAGTNNETHTKGTFYQANGKPAVGARVRVYSAAQKETDSTTTQVAQEYVDAYGNVTLKLKPGHYSLIADSGTVSSFIDSVFSDGDKVAIPVDTLRPTGTITGYLRVQPMHSPSIAWVHLMRTNLFTKVDSTGFFRLSDVPAGSLDLVAVSHLSEYTPTHKLVRAQPDSTVHVDTIDLVYNGLPLVTGIAATYDTLSGVVTLTWHDTAYARKAGYVIYRQEGASSWASPSERGYTESSIYHDTVFGGFGATPSRYDSTELDLTYWVGAKGTDQISRAPIWNKVSMHAKSPALAKRWKVEWTSTIPLAGGVSIDTIAGGIAVLTDSGLQILSPGGAWIQGKLPSTPQTESTPVFWKGKIWVVRGAAISGNFKDSTSPYRVINWNIFDSLRILSSSDGIHWDSTTIASERDSVTGFRLHASREGLLLTATYQRLNMASWFDNDSYVLTSWASADGMRWFLWSGTPAFLCGSSGSASSWNYKFWKASVINNELDSVWTLYSKPANARTWLMRGESIDTSASILTTPVLLNIRASNFQMVFYDGSHLYLATPSSPSIWQVISPPERVRSIPRTTQNISSFPQPFCFWRGKLVVLGATGLHFATITPNQ